MPPTTKPIPWYRQRLAPPNGAGGAEKRDLPLEGLRGLCAILVLYTHALAPYQWLDPTYAPSKMFWWFSSGPVAVLFFFVLSGYVIGVTVNSPATGPAISGYLGRRLLRLVPINTAAVLLVWLLFPEITLRSVVGHLAFLQNSLPYFFDWRMPVIGPNINLWSLHYEMIFYLAFVLIWRTAPRAVYLWLLVFLIGLAVVLVDGFPAFISAYGCGLLFWIAGLTVAWLASKDQVTGNWPSALLALILMWQLDLWNRLWLVSLPHDALSRLPGLPLNRLDLIPVCVWLLLVVTGRGARWHRWLTILCLSWATTAIFHAAATGDYFNDKLATKIYAAMLGLAWLVSGWAPRPTLLAKLAPVGMISFGLYAVAMPIEFNLSRQSILPNGTVGSFTLRIIVLIGLSFGLAWILERKLQPALRLFFIRPKAVETKSGGKSPS